jgi:uncharacterized membrane protein
MTGAKLRGNGYHRSASSPAAIPARNISETERTLSLLGGGLLALYGISRLSPGGLLLSLVGAGLVYRGATGRCPVYSALGISTAPSAAVSTCVAAGRGDKVTKSVQVARPASDLYRFWRNLENLPRFMPHLLSVTTQDHRSRWVAAGPLGVHLQWDADIINDVPGKLIAWRSLPGADVDNAGAVQFQPLALDGATRVTLTLKYDPPAGKVGAMVASLLGSDPEKQIEDDLRRFKQLMEIGELPAGARFRVWPRT